MTTVGAGACEVRFDNGHVVVAHYLPHQDGAPPAGLRPGRAVRVELAHDEMKGWRLARQP